jgi:type III secretion protein D
MKLLRILTGVHAGAQLQLTPGTHRIGADDAADIRLTDWRGVDAMLHVDAAGVVTAQRASLATAVEVQIGERATSTGGGAPPDVADQETQEAVLLLDFVPMQFDDMILCIGPNDIEWPSDVDLLSTLLTRPAEEKFDAERRKRHRYTGVVAACCALGAVVLSLSIIAATQMSRAAPPRNADLRAQRVSEALAAARLTGLKAHALGNTVVVTGMVASSADDDAVRALLDRIAPTGISRKYDIAQNDAHSIEESLGIPGAHVQYSGDGQFAVTGVVTSKAALEAAVSRVRADLDSNVRSIKVTATETPSAQDGLGALSYSELVSADDVAYAQTPDGVKHIFAVDPPRNAAPATVASAPDPSSSEPIASHPADTANPASDAMAATAVAPAPAASSALEVAHVNNDQSTEVKSTDVAADHGTIEHRAAVTSLPDASTLPPGAPGSR